MREEPVISVGEVVRRLRRAVESVTPGVWIEGEVGSLKSAASGHVYFSLKDEKEEALIDCVMYRAQAVKVRRFLVDGARVQVAGRATVWAPRGRLQMTVELARPQGRGALLEALERLKTKLHGEGLFAAERKRPLPAAPRVVGVVTSSAGAAFHDICEVAFRRGGAHVVLCAAQVQGDGAVDSIVRALDLIERHPLLDVLIVGRGGGSGEDLMAFNDERVVRRIAATRVPVVSAVGHEIDTTLADLAADVRAATPSQAAELVVAEQAVQREALGRTLTALGRAFRARLLEDRALGDALRARLVDPRFVIAARQQQVDELLRGLERRVTRRIGQHRDGVEQRRKRLFSRHPRVVLTRARSGLEQATLRLRGALRLALQARRAELARRASQLESLSPLAVLGRGYAIAHRVDGRVVRASSELAAGDELRVRFGRGSAAARVTSVSANDETGGRS